MSDAETAALVLAAVALFIAWLRVATIVLYLWVYPEVA